MELSIADRRLPIFSCRFTGGIGVNAKGEIVGSAVAGTVVTCRRLIGANGDDRWTGGMLWAAGLTQTMREEGGDRMGDVLEDTSCGVVGCPLVT